MLQPHAEVTAAELAGLATTHQPGFSLPSAFYVADAAFELDMERIFMRSWLYVGHVSQIAERGDYFLFEIANESVIVVRDSQDEIHALANVCRHRGSRVCREPSGNSKAFVCPYHGWVYDLDGGLRSKRYMGQGFDPSKYGLKRVQSRIFEGLIFINFADQPSDFSLSTEKLGELLAPLELDSTKVAARANYPVEANWKLALENYLECYHCSPAHPEYAKVHALRLPDDRLGPLREQFYQGDNPNGLSNEKLNEGYSVGVFEPEVYYCRSPLADNVLSGSEDGQPVAPLLGRLVAHDGGQIDVSIGLVTFLLIYTDHAVVYRFTPRGPKRADMEVTWLVNESATEGVDYDLDKLTWMWDVTSKADKRIIDDNQAGVCSRFYEPGPYSEMESAPDSFAQWYLRTLFD